MVIKYFQKPFFLAVLICCFIFYSGLFNIQKDSEIVSLFSPDEITKISGTILNSPSKSSSGKYYSVKFQIDAIETMNTYKSSAIGILNLLIPSESVETFFPGKLYSKSQKTGAYLYEAGGHYVFEGSYKNTIFIASKCIKNTWPSSIFGKIDFFRALCRLQFKRLMYSWGKAGGLLLSLLSGAKEYTEQDISEGFKNSGLSHILALSGMHLSMFSSIAIFLGNRIGRKKLTFILRIITLILFVWFAGFSPSLLRAFICSCLGLIAIMSGKKQPDMTLILCFSFIIQCIISPADIWNIGFMLSYGALAGIFIFNTYIFKFFSKILPGYFAASLASSCSAQTFTIPIALKKFGSFSPIGIIATTVVSPFITIFIYSGLLLILICLVFPVIQGPSGIFMNLQYTIIKFLVSYFSKFPKWSVN